MLDTCTFQAKKKLYASTLTFLSQLHVHKTTFFHRELTKIDISEVNKAVFSNIEHLDLDSFVQFFN